MNISPWLLERIVCPRDGQPLAEDGQSLTCPDGHSYPVVEGVPVLLTSDLPHTLWVREASLQEGQRGVDGFVEDPYYLGTLGISDKERAALREQLRQPGQRVDPVVSHLIGATNGMAYLHLIGKLPDYPIPDLRLPQGHGETLVDIGCNWGRWCVAAARKGYRPIGIDPSLGAVLAAKRVIASLGLEAQFVVGDARVLPFRPGCIDVAFSYSVLQHFSRGDAARSVAEIGRVLRPGGKSFVQMPTILGLRCLYHQARRRFREPKGFEVRYWSVPELKRLFNGSVGPTNLSVDCFFGIGLQASDLRLMPFTHRLAIQASELLRKTSRVFPPLNYVADSVYLESTADTGLNPVPPR